jgi:hypothetical protein
MRYLPLPLLENVDLERLDVSEFLDYVAQARVVQEIEENILLRAIVKAFSTE